MSSGRYARYSSGNQEFGPPMNNGRSPAIWRFVWTEEDQLRICICAQRSSHLSYPQFVREV